MSIILEVKGLTKKFGKLTAVDSLNFKTKKGKVYGLLGPNGSGKSTTLGMILNVVNKTSGEVKWFDGKKETYEALKKIGAIIERPNFYPYLTAFQNLELVCKIKQIDKGNISEVLKQVNLLERKDDKFKSFSLGMKQRLAIASALLNQPELLILDEPTNGLDPQGIHEIREIIKNISGKGVTVILASHLLDEVEKVCDEVIVLKEGKKIWEGNVKEISQNKQWYEIEVKQIAEAKEILSKLTSIKSVKIYPDKLKVFTNNLEGSEINKILASHNIYINQLVKKSKDLEQQFLEITTQIK